jgi:hypothetical protein
MKPLSIFFITLFVVSMLFLSCGAPLSAQATNEQQIGLANYVKIKGEAVSDGDIVVVEGGQYRKSKSRYDFKIIGVATSQPALALDYTNKQGNVAVVVSGVATVKVSGENGAIAEGDYITTSSVSGIGMKATEPGYVLGIALAGYDGSTKEQIAKIPVSLEVDYSFNPLFKGGRTTERLKNNIFDIFSLSSVAVYESPSVVFKYVVAAFIIVFCVAIGFLTFSRVASNGIQAIGRNPMAGKMINLGIFLNVALTLGIIGAGIVVAYFVVVL